jgi:C_GCAxxG_C_C family probable redox protein
MKELKNKLIRKAFNLGREYESIYRGCAQCTLGALQDTFNKREDSVFKASTGLATGIGLMGSSVCGGYSGGALFMGQLIGRDIEHFRTESSSKSGIFNMIKLLYQKYIAEYETVTCHNIQDKIFGRSFDLHKKDEKEIFEKMGGHKDKCPCIVGKAAAWTAEIILGNLKIFKIEL